MNGLQGGDPAKLAKALFQLASQDEPPFRWPAGADAVGTFERKANDLLAQANAYRDLSSSLAFDQVGGAELALQCNNGINSTGDSRSKPIQLRSGPGYSAIARGREQTQLVVVLSRSHARPVAIRAQ
jgi:hypothetical protein